MSNTQSNKRFYKYYVGDTYHHNDELCIVTSMFNTLSIISLSTGKIIKHKIIGKITGESKLDELFNCEKLSKEFKLVTLDKIEVIDIIDKPITDIEVGDILMYGLLYKRFYIVSEPIMGYGKNVVDMETGYMNDAIQHIKCYGNLMKYTNIKNLTYK